MCLDNIQYGRGPYSKSKFRYKRIIVRQNSKTGKLTFAPIFSIVPRYQPPGKWGNAHGNRDNDSSFGFHTLLNARDVCGPIANGWEVRFKVEVSGHLKSGSWENKPSETWRRMKLLYPVTLNGRKVPLSKLLNRI